MSPAEQIERFIKAHPGEWRAVPTDNPDEMTFVLEVYPYRIKVEAYLSAVRGSLEHVDHHDTPSLDPCPVGASLLTQIAYRGADALQTHGGTCDTLPPWLADPVRRILRARAGELLTLAGSSPADVVSAAETVDEALCARPAVESTLSAVLAVLQGIGMSCRWVLGEPLILIGDFVYLREDLDGVPVDDFADFAAKHGDRRLVKGDEAKAPKVHGYRVFMALTPEPLCPV